MILISGPRRSGSDPTGGRSGSGDDETSSGFVGEGRRIGQRDERVGRIGRPGRSEKTRRTSRPENVARRKTFYVSSSKMLVKVDK